MNVGSVLPNVLIPSLVRPATLVVTPPNIPPPAPPAPIATIRLFAICSSVNFAPLRIAWYVIDAASLKPSATASIPAAFIMLEIRLPAAPLPCALAIFFKKPSIGNSVPISNKVVTVAPSRILGPERAGLPAFIFASASLRSL